MSKKLQATVEDGMLEEIEKIMAQERFYETSEFVKHCIRCYIVLKEAGVLSPGRAQGINSFSPTAAEAMS